MLGGLIIAFFAGYFAHNLVANANNITAYSFSTPDLINFVLSVLLSGASIILAVSAISLGKFSEQAMIQRSDESIRLQNEVFQKTTDALQRIESSTGVTEKRLEDIISGRVGDLSQKLAKITTETKDKDISSRQKKIEEILRQNLTESIGNLRLSDSDQQEMQLKKQKEIVLERQKYENNHSQLESGITARKDLRAIKLGQGDPTEKGIELFDIVFVNKDEKKIGVIDFPNTFEGDVVHSVIEATIRELVKDTIDFVHIVIYTPNEEQEKSYNNVLEIVSPELKTRISFNICLPEQIDKFVKDL